MATVTRDGAVARGSESAIVISRLIDTRTVSTALSAASNTRHRCPALPDPWHSHIVLQCAFELISFAVDRGEIIVGQLAPLFLDLAFDLLPIAFHPIPVHERFSLSR